MKWIPAYSIRTLCGTVAFVALLLGMLVWAHALLAIDPESETVTLCGVPANLRWNLTDWDAGHQGVFQPHEQLGSIPAGRRPSVVAEIKQELLQLSYDDYVGNRTFAVTIRVDGWHANDWRNYLIDVNVSGGGIADGGFACDYDFSDSTRTLTIRVSQFIHRSRIAKTTTIRFRHDGASFAPLQADEIGK